MAPVEWSRPMSRGWQEKIQCRCGVGLSSERDDDHAGQNNKDDRQNFAIGLYNYVNTTLNDLHLRLQMPHQPCTTAESLNHVMLIGMYVGRRCRSISDRLDAERLIIIIIIAPTIISNAP